MTWTQRVAALCLGSAALFILGLWIWAELIKRRLARMAAESQERIAESQRRINGSSVGKERRTGDEREGSGDPGALIPGDAEDGHE